MSKKTEILNDVVIRFAGDSGDGMQLTGMQFTNTTALAGNDLSTLPDYPAEIRAPAGTLFGVSSFQLHFSSWDILTPGDHPDVLVAMNPAALKVHLKDLKNGGLILANTDSFDDKNLELAGYEANPLTDGSLDKLSSDRCSDHQIDSECIAGNRAHPERDGSVQEFFCSRIDVLDVLSGYGTDGRMDPGQVQQRTEDC